ncbi:nucleobase-ascorbate transporter 4 [Juglans microcarpa x Juglans regia]|uniref:nucleobase-ascorbate transporter 4 n=1 Tax=Juglans microcarpa x Juglans regia TaxID=2249226 RepID=UPI001B7DFA86|nr:nucleobase-ascorbate transporter 4 [Juglans microcarpa x Juglans regia]
MAVGGGGGGANEFLPHPVKEQHPGVDFCVSSSPAWPEAILLGFQHYLVMLGTIVIISTILVPLMGGGNVEKAQVIDTFLFVAGINTLLQTLFGTRLPVVMGASYAFIIPIISLTLSRRFSGFTDPRQRFKQTMRAVQGALIISSLFQMIFGFFGFWRILARFLSPLAAIPLVTLTGLGLFARGFPQLAKCIEVGLPELIILVVLSQYISSMIKSKRAIFDRYAVLLSVAIVWVYAEILTVAGAYDNRSLKTQISCRTDRAGLISASPWIRVPYPFQWGSPTFNAGDALAMMAAAFVAIIESTGTYIAASRYGSATHMPPSVLSRGVGWQGIGTLLNGIFGTGTGSTASVENAGLLGLTRVGSRRVVQISAGFMLFFSVLGKFGAVVASIPLPVVAALYCVLFAYVASAGLTLLQFINLNCFRSKFILGFALFMGLSVPQYFNDYLLISGRGPLHTGAIWFNDIVQVLFSSPATVAAIVAFILDSSLGRGHSSTRRDSGRHWWEKFRYYNQDTRSEEFYGLPYNLNRFFPSF